MENAEVKRNDSGLYLVSDPRSEVTQQDIDIVAIHGLNGHCFETWTHHGKTQAARTFWLKDLLPDKMPHARIWTFQYDAKIMGSESMYEVPDTARLLLQQLRTQRRPKDQGRPIIFLVHSLGGIIIKQAIQIANTNFEFSDIAASTKGIVFFGTPHRGSDLAKWGSMLSEAAMAAAPGQWSSKLIPILETYSERLLELSDDFRPFAGQYAIVSFYEQHVHPVLGNLVVDKDSVILGLAHEDIMMLGGDHSSMCKFFRDDPRFESVWRAIERAVEGPPVMPVSRRARRGRRGV
ncbi:protein SERAC1 [Podospora australis]|uniref:Protein SERAC1 n=1 Tax=Podospora australis TaxID=1536484 RepID=A0AAN6WPN5_9PEZI|nr:protein SERAC1 [Podospora australis]